MIFASHTKYRTQHVLDTSERTVNSNRSTQQSFQPASTLASISTKSSTTCSSLSMHSATGGESIEAEDDDSGGSSSGGHCSRFTQQIHPETFPTTTTTTKISSSTTTPTIALSASVCIASTSQDNLTNSLITTTTTTTTTPSSSTNNNTSKSRPNVKPNNSSSVIDGRSEIVALAACSFENIGSSLDFVAQVLSRLVIHGDAHCRLIQERADEMSSFGGAGAGAGGAAGGRKKQDLISWGRRIVAATKRLVQSETEHQAQLKGLIPHFQLEVKSLAQHIHRTCGIDPREFVCAVMMIDRTLRRLIDGPSIDISADDESSATLMSQFARRLACNSPRALLDQFKQLFCVTVLLATKSNEDMYELCNDEYYYRIRTPLEKGIPPVRESSSATASSSSIHMLSGSSGSSSFTLRDFNRLERALLSALDWRIVSNTTDVQEFAGKHVDIILRSTRGNPCGASVNKPTLFPRKETVR